MEPNPYEAPKEEGTAGIPELRDRLARLRLVVAFLIGVVAFQWVCHFLTAMALGAYIDSAKNVGPTAKTLDSSLYGVCCISLTAILSLVAGFLGVFALRTREN